MKTALLLGAYCSGSSITIKEPLQSRDHTEQMLKAFGTGIRFTNDNLVYLPATSECLLPKELEYSVPADLSSAVFMLGAAVITKKNIVIRNVGLNPTRKAFFDLISDCGVRIAYSSVSQTFGERFADITIY